MRALMIALATVLAFSVSACTGSDMPNSGMPTSGMSTTAAPRSAPVSQVPEAFDAVESTLADAEKFAVELEQVFFGTGYPKDLAGAVAAAKKTGLELADGNSIASYVFDPDNAEFRLCVENTSGAWATYDTRPMAMRESGPSGGCPG